MFLRHLRFAAAALSLSACSDTHQEPPGPTGPAVRPSAPYQVVLTNNLSVPVKELYLWSCSEADPGLNRLDRSLPPNAEVVMEVVEPGCHNALAKSIGGRTLKFRLMVGSGRTLWRMF